MPNCPETVLALVITGGPTVIVKASVADPVPAAFVALIVMLEDPTAVGVPVIAPVEVFTLSHPGKPVAAKLVGALLAVIT